MITTYVQGGDEQDINKARLVIPVKAHNDSLKYQSAYDEESSLIKIQRGSNMAKPIGDFTVDEKSRKVFHKGEECKEEKDIAKIIKGINKKRESHTRFYPKLLRTYEFFIKAIEKSTDTDYF